ncbi:DUF192 domain-containing protein [Candidatus Woesearchaeota archaeon]|nr:DUF192 domain-containing protein [Candidatus Woesearchaeota archaeon]
MIEIINKGIILADKVKINKDILSKMRGLMFSKPLKKGEALVLVSDEEGVFETTLHMFFVFFSIDILWLDKEYSVVDKREGVRSFTPLIIPKKAAKYVIELPKKTAQYVGIGDVVEFRKV